MQGFTKGRSVETLTAAVLYAACRNLSVPVTLREICQYSNESKKTISKFYRLMINKKIFSVPSPNYEIYIDRVLDKLKQKSHFKNVKAINNVRRKSINIMKKAQSSGLLHGKKPASIVSSIIYIATERGINQSVIATAAGVTEVTLRNNLRKLESIL